VNAGDTFIAKIKEIHAADPSCSLSIILNRIGVQKRKVGIRLYDLAHRWRDLGIEGKPRSKPLEKVCIHDAKALSEHHGDDLPRFAIDLLDEILQCEEKKESDLPVDIDEHAFDRYRFRVGSSASRLKMTTAIIAAIEKGREVRLRNVTEQARKIARFGQTRYFHNSSKGFVAVVSYKDVRPRVVSIYFYDDTRWKEV
jgi:hypothetical protein